MDEVEELQIRVPNLAPEIFISAEEKTKKEKKKPKKKFGKSKSMEQNSPNVVQNCSTEDQIAVDIHLRSKSLTKKAKVTRSSSYMFPGFRNRSKTSDQKAGEVVKQSNKSFSSWKGISYKDKSSSIDRLKVRLSKSRSSSLKRKSLQSSTCSIDADIQMPLSASLTSLSTPIREVSSLDRRNTSVTVNPPYHDPLFDSTNMELADALGRPPPPPPRYCQGAPNSSQKQPMKKKLTRKSSSKSHTSETSVEIESEYTEFGEISALPQQISPKKPTTLNLKAGTPENAENKVPGIKEVIGSVYEEVTFIDRPKIEPNKQPSLAEAGKFKSFDSSIGYGTSDVNEILPPRRSTGLPPPKATSPIKRRGAKVRRQSRQKSFDISTTIESEYSCLGEIPRPISLELEKGVTEGDMKEEIASLNKTRKADTPRPSSALHSVTVPRSDRKDTVDSIYCELGDVLPVDDPTPTADVEEMEEKIDISKYRKDSQSSAYDLSETDENSNDNDEPIYAVVRKDRIKSQSIEPAPEDLKFVEVKSGFGFGETVDEEETETETDAGGEYTGEVTNSEDKETTSDGEMYYATSDSSCGSPIKRRLVVKSEEVEGRNCVISSESQIVILLH